MICICVIVSIFVSTWRVTNENQMQIELPLLSNGEYRFAIDWGDGSQDFITEYKQGVHVYKKTGKYILRITGTIIGIGFCDGLYTAKKSAKQILEISQWGPLRLGNSAEYFYECVNLQISATDPLDLTGTQDMCKMFYGCKALREPDFNNWDTSHVTNMSYMFYKASNFNGKIGAWNTSSVRWMHFMFADASAFNGEITEWNTSSVQGIWEMFVNASSFNKDLSGWKVGAVTNHRNFDLGGSVWRSPRPVWGPNEEQVRYIEIYI